MRRGTLQNAITQACGCLVHSAQPQHIVSSMRHAAHGVPGRWRCSHGSSTPVLLLRSFQLGMMPACDGSAHTQLTPRAAAPRMMPACTGPPTAPADARALLHPACTQTYAQPVYEIFDKTLGNIYRPCWNFRNLMVRLIFRTAFIAFCCFIGALVPFFGAGCFSCFRSCAGIDGVHADLRALALLPCARTLVSGRGIRCLLCCIGVLAHHCMAKATSPLRGMVVNYRRHDGHHWRTRLHAHGLCAAPGAPSALML
jgi:hypothetical protein